MNPHDLLFDRVRYSYPDGHEALRNLSFRISRGEKVALVGANGAGKSTLLLLADGLLTPSHGKVVVGGIELTGKTVRQIRQSVGMVFQNSDDQLFMPTVEEDVAFGPANMGLTRGEIARRVTEALAAVGASHLRQAPPYTLSGGQKKRVALATVLAMDPSILVLDEPTAGLDPRARRQTIELLHRFRHTMLVATHDLEMAAGLCERTIVLQQGRIVADAPTEQLFRDLPLLEACGLEQPGSFARRRETEETGAVG